MGKLAFSKSDSHDLARSSAVQYVRLYREYLRSSPEDRRKVLEQMRDVVSTISNRPVFSSELLFAERGPLSSESSTMMRWLLRHQIHELKHGNGASRARASL
ncbi:MAG: hypothetical protein KGH94_05340 [Candidatus Micrarchaeota archaeon]|nr:hypothetical protein [Candidatus Micrarchaeota archaeon]